MFEQPAPNRSERLPEQIVSVPAKNLTSRITVALGAILIAAGLFGGGLLVGKTIWQGSDTAETAYRPGGPGRLDGPFGGGFRMRRDFGMRGGPGTHGDAGSGITGTVQQVDGNTVYVQRTDGIVMKVSILDSTTITESLKGSSDGLKPGQTVLVQGRTNSDGSVTAERITEVGGHVGAGGGTVGGDSNNGN